MSVFTLDDIKTLVKEPLDIEAEDFVSDDELTRYINQGIREAEAEIHNVYQDYYLAAPYTLQITAGQNEYVLPSDIYATKIRKLVYDDGSTTRGSMYIVKRIRNIEDIAWVEKDEGDPPRFTYMVTNDKNKGNRLTLYPTPTQNFTTEFKLYYLREARQLENDSDEIDIPEFVDFVVLFARYEVLKKELGNPLLDPTKVELEAKRNQMVNTLIKRFPDGDSEIIQDTSFYEDFHYNYYSDYDYWY